MRLTDKLENGNYDILEQEDVCVARPLRPERYHLMIQKLGQLEDIEEELGIDLITLFNVLKNGYAWIKTKQGIQKATVGAFSLKNLKVVLSYDMSEGGWNFHKNMHLTDYGKTWALTKEELL